ncbi:hypothetical protein RHSIM_Rhsim02G0133900 [Rhododendron simsii]|uniref:Protein NUCLEAR FUSION DEFECTIVE 6, chloroplastic/mitochondrial-like n=1 Tax=Rhododendron simsii TaxID=118357 RepID=A0A834HIJ6_RHOSS|nr:hypothetical protein RHSIM_Rhsim02G0133900 [Rhododendron simsii]
MYATASRSVLRSAAAARSAGARLAAVTKPKAAAQSPFCFPTRKPLSSRIFRSPVEMSCVSVDSMLPLHTATASALLTSMLSVAPRCYGWTFEGNCFFFFSIEMCVYVLLSGYTMFNDFAHKYYTYVGGS